MNAKQRCSARAVPSREELDLIQIPACSLIIERLLPDRPVSPGDQWQHSEDLLATLLNLDALSFADVTTTFKDATPAASEIGAGRHRQGSDRRRSDRNRAEGRCTSST